MFCICYFARIEFNVIKYCMFILNRQYAKFQMVKKRLAPHMKISTSYDIKDEYSLHFWNFWKIDFYNSLANSWILSGKVTPLPANSSCFSSCISCRSRLIIEKYFNHWRKPSFTSIIWIICNMICFILEYFIRSSSSLERFEISINHIMLIAWFI